LLLSLVCEKVGPTIDGKLMAVFRVPSNDKTVYFLFDSQTSMIVECDMKGKPIPGCEWEHITPQKFVYRYWTGKVSALSKIYVYGKRLDYYKRESMYSPCIH
jgi:hypothetical protein